MPRKRPANPNPVGKGRITEGMSWVCRTNKGHQGNCPKVNCTCICHTRIEK